MPLEIRQSLRLVQQPIMTPQLQQAIKLLQLSRMELVDLVRQEQEENPILEEVIEPSVEAEPLETNYETLTPSPSEVKETSDEEKEIPRLDWGTRGYSSRTRESGEEDERPTFENFLTKKTTLSDHLFWQLLLNNFTEEERLIGTLIIGNLNEDGLLQLSPEEIASQSGLEIPAVERVIQEIQAFDPPGVAARDVRECLLLQAKQVYPGEILVQKIITDHLSLLAKKNYQAIAKGLGVSLEEVVRATRRISELDPKPGRSFSDENILYITPDVYVYKVGDEYVVVLNEDGVPKLRINPYYRDILREQAQSTGEAREYINEKIRSALWLIKSIHQRQRTIYRVAKSIVKFQREFLDRGVSFLKPMILKDVAMDVDMHESTISRVTSNKYMHTPQGIFELKYFFNSSINTSRGENIASESVKEKIREILSKEDRQRPYSDQELVEILKKQDILIARRTVTKYREILGVLPSTWRKQII
ncbi:MAG: RNA polymerase factor sigma-54 [Deltaproteobacteria bacterium]|nr:RNA polymerase factor sigma-54 [Deltaproteobacteria bacterium]